MRRQDIEVPASGLVDAALAAEIVEVTVNVIRVWKCRGHIDFARDIDGQEFRDSQGRKLFNLVDVIDAEYRLRKRARRNPVRYSAA